MRLELQIMQALWTGGPISIREILDEASRVIFAVQDHLVGFARPTRQGLISMI
jgi:hypothetical protein